MVFDTFSGTQTLCRPDRNGNTTCCFSDASFLFRNFNFNFIQILININQQFNT